jgi:UDP-glucose 4-epimerase
MRALVTGGAGFLGHRLVERLLAERFAVTVVDDLSGGSLDHLALARGSPAFAFRRGDVRARALLDDLVPGMDVTFHLAGAVGVRRVAEDPAGTWSRNVEGSASVLEACARHGVRTIVVSTSEVYGTRATGVLSEDAPCLVEPAARRDVYAVSKMAGESLALALHRSALLPVTVVRPFNVVGPRQSDRYGMVLPRFAKAAVLGEPLPVHGDGRQTRTFLHVDDAVDAFLRLARAGASEGLVVNVGGTEEIPILDLAHRVIARAGATAGVRFVPFAQVYGEGFVDPMHRRPDVSRLAALTGFAPTKTLDDAIDDALVWARTREGSPVSG